MSLDLLPFDILKKIFDLLDYKSIFKILQVNSKFKNANVLKENIIWKKFFRSNYLNYPICSKYYYNILKKLYIYQQFSCFHCCNEINSEYYLVICNNCDSHLPYELTHERSYNKYHFECLSVKKNKYSALTYILCPICNFTSPCIKCNIYS